MTWRDFCKHYGPCEMTSGDKCKTPDDPAYIAKMESRLPSGPDEASEEGRALCIGEDRCGALVHESGCPESHLPPEERS